MILDLGSRGMVGRGDGGYVLSVKGDKEQTVNLTFKTQEISATGYA